MVRPQILNTKGLKHLNSQRTTFSHINSFFAVYWEIIDLNVVFCVYYIQDRWKWGFGKEFEGRRVCSIWEKLCKGQVEGKTNLISYNSNLQFAIFLEGLHYLLFLQTGQLVVVHWIRTLTVKMVLPMNQLFNFTKMFLIIIIFMFAFSLHVIPRIWRYCYSRVSLEAEILFAYSTIFHLGTHISSSIMALVSHGLTCFFKQHVGNM